MTRIDPVRKAAVISGGTALCLVAMAGVATAQPVSQATLERALYPTRFLQKAPQDPCAYLPCPNVDVILDRLTGDIIGGRTFPASQQVRFAVVNLNPFRHASRVSIDVVPYDPNASGDFITEPVRISPVGRAFTEDSVGMGNLPPCRLTPVTRTRLRQLAADIREARKAMSVWHEDSLVNPLHFVESFASDLRSTIYSEYSRAQAIYVAAWQLRQLAAVYPPALRSSRLLDSIRIVRLRDVHADLVREVAAFDRCQDDEVRRWRGDAEVTAGTLASARDAIRDARGLADQIEKDATGIWATASIPENFYIKRSMGGYPAPRTVFVRLFLSRTDGTAREGFRVDEPAMGWNFTFRP